MTVDPTSSGVCAITGGVVSFKGAGSCILNANQPGNASFAAASQVQQLFTVGKGSQTVAITSTSASPAVGGSYTVATTGGTSSSPVVLTIDPASTSGACSISGATVSYLKVGRCIIDANQAGNANYNPSIQVQQTVTVGEGAQTITFGVQPGQTYSSGGTFAVSPLATTTSGLPIADSSTTTGVRTVSGTTVTIVTAGTCAITADQAGNANRDPAALESCSRKMATANGGSGTTCRSRLLLPSRSPGISQLGRSLIRSISLCNAPHISESRFPSRKASFIMRTFCEFIYCGAPTQSCFNSRSDGAR